MERSLAGDCNKVTIYGMNSRATQLKLICMSVHVTLRMLLALSQVEKYFFWPIRMLNW